MSKHIWTVIFLFISTLQALGQNHELTYTIKEYNADAGDYVLSACGERPVGAFAYFENKYGETAGNRFNQIPRNCTATFGLVGFEDCIIDSLTLYMCSNNKAGTFSLTVTDDEETSLYKHSTATFAEWYGMWLSKDHGLYGSIGVKMTEQCPITGDVAITIKGGTQEGSVYLSAVTLHYRTEGKVESPLGYTYEKLVPKSTLNDGDAIILYRSGDAATDIDGMETSHYLDAVGISSTSDIQEHEVEVFTLNHDASGSHWVLTDQYGRKLGAEKAQQLAWDAGVMTWDIKIDYSGAYITSTHTQYGTIRYNAPAGSWPRFWNYTSTSLPLPYIYRRERQLTAVTSTAIEGLPSVRDVELGAQDTLVLQATLLPAKVTDRRMEWQSSYTDVATVKDGIVTLHGAGTAVVTATAKDGGASAQTTIMVHTASGISTIHTSQSPRKIMKDRQILIQHQGTLYRTDGVRSASVGK